MLLVAALFTRSWSAMARFAGESQTPVALEGIPISVPPTPSLAPSVLVSPSLVQLPPLHAVGQWQTCAPLDPVTESISVSVVPVLKAPLTPPSQGYVTFDTSTATATLAIDSRLPRQSMSRPSEPSPPPVLQLSIPLMGPLRRSTSS